MKKLGFVLVFLCLVALVPYHNGQTKSRTETTTIDGVYAPQELLVKFSVPLNTPSVQSVNAQMGATVIQEFADLGWQLVRLPEGVRVNDAMARYQKVPGVELAQPNFYYHLPRNEQITEEQTPLHSPQQPAQTPNDPRFGEMYGLTNISAPAAWDMTTGSNQVVVAVIDTGARYTHEDLAPNMWNNPGEIANNGIDDDGNGFIDDFYGWDFFFNDSDPLDENGHGTHTAGTVGAKGNNGLGVTGVNWNVRVMPLKIYNSSGNGTTSVMLINTYNYVRLMKNRGVNIRVTSNSYGGCDEACGFDQATKDALDALGNVGVLNVFAAGNNNTNSDITPFYPANYDSPHIVSVAASTQTDTRASFSNYGATTVDLAAPGVSILSTVRGSDSTYGNSSGTSMACPHVAGAAALLAAANPALSNYSLKASLMNSVDVLPQWNGIVLSGGRMNIARAIQSPTVCAYNLSAPGLTIDAAGGGSSVNLNSPTNCGWEAKTTANWITINTTNRVGAGNGTIGFTVAANAGNTRSAAITIGGQTFTVTQNGPALPTLSINDVSVTEGNSGTTNAVFTVSLSAASTQTVTVDYASADGTATAGSDYVGLRAGTLTFAPNTTTQQLSVTVNGDTLFELDETFFVNLTNPTNATLADAQGQGTIVNDDPAPSIVSLSAATYTVNEGDGHLTVTVNRTGNIALAGTVNYATQDTSLTFTPALPCSHPDATRGRCDFVPVAGTLRFAANETSKTFAVPIIDDMFSEANETFKVVLLPGGVNTIFGAIREATVTIQDNDSVSPAGRTYIAQLSGAQEVPANSSTAIGTGTVMLNELENQITVSLSFSGLGSAQTAAHIHGVAHPGINAPVVFGLSTGTVSGVTFNVTPGQAAQLKRGLFYFNVHTANFPGGEIRGQILPNPLENARFFVRQQYLDFLSRVPDQAGWDYWTGQIATTCGTDLACLHTRRLDVSTAFFIEQEFQETGAFVYRLYKAAYGEQVNYRPLYDQFVPDRAQVIGGTDLAAGKLQEADSVVQNPTFTARYPASMNAAQFVDAILQTVQSGAGVTFTNLERDACISDVNTGGRALMMRNLADNMAFKNAVFNRAFVLMQYFGYLKRDPDQAGYDFWLNILNQQPNNSRGMVCAFVTADEYQQRFSAVSTRNNQDCGQ